MKILSLGLDKSILDKNSSLAERAIEYGNLVVKYTVIVPNQKKAELDLSERVKVFGATGGAKIFKFINIWKQGKKILLAEKYDVITVQDVYFLALVGLFLAEKFKIGLEIQVHGFEKLSFWRRMIVNYVLPRAGAVRVVSQRLKKQVQGEFLVKEERITAVPIYTDIKIRNQEVKIRNSGEFIFLTVGRLVPVKNIALQIEAMAEIVKKYPQTKMWIVGDGPERGILEVLSSRLKVADKVKFFGHQDDLSEFYKKADSFLLTSDSEGWGLAVVEAAAAGLPIIMTDVGCSGELIRNNESGLVISSGDRQGLVLAMQKLLDDPNMAEKIARGAGQEILKLPDKDETSKIYKSSWQKAADFPLKISFFAELFKEKTDNTLIQLFRYTFVGGVAFLVDFGLLYILTEYLNFYYLLSATISFVAGLAINYTLSIFWIFSSRTLSKRWLEFGIFGLIGVVGLCLNALIMWFFTEQIHFYYLSSKIISTILVYLWNFFARKFTLFNK